MDTSSLTFWLWSDVALLSDNLGNAGFVVIGLFALCWLVSMVNYRWRNYDSLVVR